MKKTLVILLACYIVYFSSAFRILQTGNRWTAPAEASKLENPLSDQKAGAKGENLFATNCERCHGSKGVGDGVDGRKLNPKPADLTSHNVQKQSDGEIFWKISNGRGEMPSFKKDLKESDRWKLVNYIHQLAAGNGSATR